MPRLAPNAYADRILEGNDHAVDSGDMLDFLAGDVDVNKDNNKELSAGLGFSAIGATITAP